MIQHERHWLSAIVLELFWLKTETTILLRIFICDKSTIESDNDKARVS